MQILSVQGLTKRYERFTLDGVSFSLEPGYIMGFIGRNGAGKTTTLKSMLNLVHPDGGSVSYFGRDYLQNEFWCKQRLGFMLGGVDYYPRERIRTIAEVTRRFYDEWDQKTFADYLDRFELDPAKRVSELSDGMKVKFSLALALSHNAELLILDEPTSGLDPVSRDDLVELFQSLIEDGKRSILFSTHITSDLEKCADYITYIRRGKIVASAEKDAFINAYRIVKGEKAALTDGLKQRLIGIKTHSFGFEALMHTEEAESLSGMSVEKADLDSIMIHCDKE